MGSSAVAFRGCAFGLGLGLVLVTAAPACGLDGGGVGSANGASGGPVGGGGADASGDALGGPDFDGAPSGDDGPASSETGATGDDGPSTTTDAAGGDGGACSPPCTAQQVCGTAGLCVAARRVFVSSTQSNGNLGGTGGADTHCQTLANAASLGGQWKSWTSDDTTSPSARFTQSADPYTLLDARVVAINWTSLTTVALVNGIDLDEKKKKVGADEVWTGTRQNGTSLSGCNGFTTSGHGDSQPFVGRVGNTDKGWTESATDARCDQNNLRVYCFEQ